MLMRIVFFNIGLFLCDSTVILKPLGINSNVLNDDLTSYFLTNSPIV